MSLLLTMNSLGNIADQRCFIYTYSLNTKKFFLWYHKKSTRQTGFYIIKKSIYIIVYYCYLLYYCIIYYCIT